MGFEPSRNGLAVRHIRSCVVFRLSVNAGHFAHRDPTSSNPADWEFRNVMQSKPSYLLSLSEQDIAEGLVPAARREEVLIWNTFGVGFWDQQGQRAFASRGFPDLKLLQYVCLLLVPLHADVVKVFGAMNRDGNVLLPSLLWRSIAPYLELGSCRA